MQRWLLDLLVCPECRDARGLTLAGTGEAAVEDGELGCPGCGAAYPIRNGIPRFVPQQDDYAGNFGFQWNRWKTLQVDRLAGHRLSQTRFFADSRLPPEWLPGRLILDAGCGAGRFTDVAAQAGARVVAVDLSEAIDACRVNCANPQGHTPGRGEVAQVQANLLRLPFRDGVFDGLFCMGVIQHTPDPAAVMSALPRLLKAGAPLAYNFYEWHWLRRLEVIKYGLRRTTPDWPQGTLLGFCRVLVALLFPLTLVLAKIPKLRFFVRFIPIAAVHNPALTLRQQYDWTLLDTFDWYGPRYEQCQDHGQVAGLLQGLDLAEVDSRPGLAWARRPG